MTRETKPLAFYLRESRLRRVQLRGCLGAIPNTVFRPAVIPAQSIDPFSNETEVPK
jgi:hypothetical protein